MVLLSMHIVPAMIQRDYKLIIKCVMCLQQQNVYSLAKYSALSLINEPPPYQQPFELWAT